MSAFEGGRGRGGRDRGRGGRDGGGGRGGRGGRDGGRGGRDGGRGGRDGGRGGRDGGRGGRDGGRGGRGGKNRTMAEVISIKNCLQGSGMRNNDILAVINPPGAQRVRNVENPRMPGHEEWRNTPTVGHVLDNQTQVVRSNHFRVNYNFPGIPGRFYQYHVHIKRYRYNGELSEDVAHSEDYRVNTALVLQLQNRHPEWNTFEGRPVGFTYDSRSTVFTTHELPLPGVGDDGAPTLGEDIHVPNADNTDSIRRYRVIITSAGDIVCPATDLEGWRRNRDPALIRALDSCLLSFARADQGNDAPQWYLVGNKGFSSRGEELSLSPGFFAMRGYFMGLKTCMAGLVLVSDMSVAVFLNGGPLINVICDILGLNPQELITRYRSGNISGGAEREVNDTLKNTKIKIVHLGHSRKFKELGPPANSNKSSFECDGRMITVADYYVSMANQRESYMRHMHNGRLKFPMLPTVNIGSLNRPILVPMELVTVDKGQNFNRKCTGKMTSQFIRHAAALPNDRFQYLVGATVGDTNALQQLRECENAGAFGVNNFESEPLAVKCRLLPPPKLRYASCNINPGLTGEWKAINDTPSKFVKVPMPSRDGSIMYGILLVGGLSRDWRTPVETFRQAFERSSKECGLNIRSGGSPLTCSDSSEEIRNRLSMMSTGGARIVIVILLGDFYCAVKYVADTMGVTTQCVKWKNVERPPRGFHVNVLLKVNTKLGGTNHTLTSVLSQGGPSRPSEKVFQDPPASLSWVFDKHCMLVGVDVCHSLIGTNGKSMAAVVGSFNGQASQYAAHISAQPNGVEIVSALEEAMTALLSTFKERNNGVVPKHIIVYRDGVGDAQFDEVLQKELPCIQNAVAAMGSMDSKISIVICQKRHNTRLVYEEARNKYINCCPGLCVDSSGGDMSIASATLNEFYLISHTAIQGTAKPCKYSLIYDEIGIKVSELELLTYWTCYLYARCNKSVSLATPAYYAHWASRRAHTLIAAGATGDELNEISGIWSRKQSTMFFI